MRDEPSRSWGIPRCHGLIPCKQIIADVIAEHGTARGGGRFGLGSLYLLRGNWNADDAGFVDGIVNHFMNYLADDGGLFPRSIYFHLFRFYHIHSTYLFHFFAPSDEGQLCGDDGFLHLCAMLK